MSPLRRTTVMLAFCLSFVGLIAGSDGHAAEFREVAVIDISADTAEAVAVLYELNRALRQIEGYRVKDVDTILSAGDASSEKANIRTAQEFYRSGLTFAEQGEWEDAAEKFEDAGRLMEQHFAYLSVAEVGDYRALLLKLAEALDADGEGERAAEVLQKAVLMKARPDGVALNEKTREAYNKAKQVVKTRSLGAIEVETEPAHAEIWVDGRFRGVSPATVAGLRQGQHILTIRKPGYLRSTQDFELTTSDSTEIEVSLKASARQILHSQLRERLAGELDELSGDGDVTGGEGVRQVGSLLFSELAIIARVSGEGNQLTVALHLFHTGTQQQLNAVTQVVDWSYRNRKAVKSLIVGLVDIDYEKALGGGVLDPQLQEAGVTSKWWFWTLIGVAAAGATTAVVLLTMPEDEPPPYDRNGNGAIVIGF